MPYSTEDGDMYERLMPWDEYYRRGSRRGRPWRNILFDWMSRACQNFHNNGNIFFVSLFKFAKFNQSEMIEAIDVCRSQHFMSELSPQRRLFITEELARYDNAQQARERDVIRQRRNEETRQLMSLIDIIGQNLEEDDFVTLTFSSRGRQTVPPPSQAVPPPSQAVSPPSQAVPPPVEEEEEDFGEDIPPDFVCPLSLSIMNKPVVASDGHTYEKNEIQKWMLQKNISPLTRAEMVPHFFPNLVLKNQIDDWKKAYRKARTEA